jgi:hypothetical protein
MKKLIVLSVYFSLIFLLPGSYSNAGLNVNINLGGSESSNYYRSLANYHRVSEKDVYFVRQRGIADEELPVIFYLASLAGVAPSLVADEYRRPGITLHDLTRIFGLNPEIYHYPIKFRVDGPPYGKAYGYYRNKPKKEWKNIKLSNTDIINLVNLRFISESRGVDPEDIIKRRSAGKNFITIDDDIVKGKSKSQAGKKKDFDQPKAGKGNVGVEKSKGKGKGKGKKK